LGELRGAPLKTLTLRSASKKRVSKCEARTCPRGNASAWFETAAFGGLLTMRRHAETATS